MGNFNRNNRSDGPQMHSAVCDECGQNCEVPFRPSSGKPIYCNNCFKGKGGDDRRGGRRDDRGSGRRDFGGGRDSGRKSMHSAVCDECGQNCEVPFRPTSGKPIYCSNCFDGKNDKSDRRGGGRDNRNSNGGEQSSKQFKMLNEKLDKVLKLLSATAPKDEPKKKVTTKKEPKEVKKTTKKKPAAKKATKKKTTKKNKTTKAKKKK